MSKHRHHFRFSVVVGSPEQKIPDWIYRSCTGCAKKWSKLNGEHKWTPVKVKYHVERGPRGRRPRFGDRKS